MNFLRRRLYEDPYNIELRHYCLIQSILNEQWNDLLQILEETPNIHFHLIQFALKYFPLPMMDNERIEKLKQRFKSFEMFKKKSLLGNNLFETDRSERVSSSSSSSTSIESLEESILFSAQGKFYKKSLNWIKIGKGECEIIQNNQLGERFLRFWILKNRSIDLVLLINLKQSERFYLYPNNSSSFMIKFQAKNECDYPISNSLFSYQIQFYSMMDVIQFKQMLSLKKSGYILSSMI